MKNNNNNQKFYDAACKTQKYHACICFLLIICFVGVGVCACGYLDDYNTEIKSAYVKVIDELKDKLPENIIEINGIRFYEPTQIEVPAQVEVYATADEFGDGTLMLRHNYYYELAYNYYEALKSAENSDNLKEYVDCLNSCFKNMVLVKNYYCSTTTDLDFNKQQAVQFNELFNLKGYGLNQTGFLPQYVSYKANAQGETTQVTCVFKGLSFVEVDKDAGDYILPADMSNAILSKKLNKKNIKVYETNFEFTYEKPKDMAFTSTEVLSVLQKYFAGEEQGVKNIKAVPTYVHEIDLTSFKMQENIFDFG